MKITTGRQAFLILIHILFFGATLFCCLLGPTLWAQSSASPNFEYFSADEGLSENTVRHILQDRQGFIWIGTENGLNRFDGYSFKTFRHDPGDPESLSNNAIRFIVEDSEGDLWIGTNQSASGLDAGKLNRLNRSTGKMERFEHNPDDPESIGSDHIAWIFLEDSDRNIWIATKEGQLNRFVRATGKFERFYHNPDDPYNPGGDKVNQSYRNSVFEDNDNNIWIGTIGGGLNRYDRALGKFERFEQDPNDPHSIGGPDAGGFFEDSRGSLWMQSNGLNRLDPNTGKFQRFETQANDPNRAKINSARTINQYEDSQGNLWIGTSYGLVRFDLSTEQMERFTHDPGDPSSISNNWVAVIYEDGLDNLWIGTGDGLNRFDRGNGTFQRFRHHIANPKSICYNNITNIWEDPTGNLWINTGIGIARMDRKKETFECFETSRGFYANLPDKSGNWWASLGLTKGLMRMDLVTNNFQHYKHEPGDANSLVDNAVYHLLEDSDSNLWIGTWPTWGQVAESGGLDRFDLNTGKFEHFKHDPNDPFSISKNEIFSLFEDSEGYLWIGYNGTGTLDRFDRKLGKVIKRYRSDRSDPTTYDLRAVTSMLEDEEGNLWFGGSRGINKLDKSTGLFHYYGPFPDGNPIWDNFIECIALDSKGHIWAGTYRRGLVRLDPDSGQFEYFPHDPDDPNSLSNNTVACIHEDANKKLWVGTPFGLNKLDPATGKFTRYFEQDGLPSASIQGILENEDGRLWLSTNKGLSCFDPQVKSYRNFGMHDGLQGNQFNWWAYHKGVQSGKFFFGGNNGFNIFHPDSIVIDTFKPPVAISSFIRYNRRDGKSVVDHFIASKEKITLSYRDNILTFEFAALNFRKTPKNQYKYQLAGFNDEWYELGNKREVTFTDLRPGNYTLRVMAANGDGIWNPEPTELAIKVLPPWWWSFWTKLVYLSLFVGLLFSLYHLLLHRKLTLVEARQLKALDAIKSKFYTNITHEFRTPLTVIQGLSNQEIEKEGDIPSEKNLDNARIIKRNSAQLLTMVNQMLDLRKLESGSLPVNLVKGDALQYLRYLTESFYSYAADHGVGLHFMTDLDKLVLDYDEDKLLHIVSNLLSNAIKFTPEGGNVYFSVDASQKPENQEVLQLRIKDTGIGIPEAQLPFIFDRFYQADHPDSYRVTRKGEGSGIGLALTRELVKLLNGTIEVKSRVEQGSTFVVSLPISREAAEAPAEQLSLEDKMLGFTAPKPFREEQSRTLVSGEDVPLALVIEDNPDVVRYLSSCLEGAYNVVTALNGKTGIDTALDLIPDIVVSDVMMPEKDGFEVCEILKNDERTSHIPIILLTARADRASRIKGLRTGADAYLAKPFNREELQVRLEQLIEIRKKIQERYCDLKSPVEKDLRTIEDTFLDKVRKVVLDHISDPEFGLVQICRALGMSRSQLFRKLKGLTGKSTSLVVRSIRLEQAKQLLQYTGLNVSEVAYEVGFKDPSFFSRLFTEEYGEPPSALRT